MNVRLTRGLGGVSAILLMAGCAPAAEPVSEMVQGECATVFGGEICTWGETLGGEVIAFGATVPAAVAENAPAEMEMVWPPVANGRIAMPEAVRAATGFDALTVYWEAHGHPPGPYLTPHWDFHFYGIPSANREAIDCSDLSKPAELPAGYALPDEEIPGIGLLVGICVPAMGMHSLPEAELTATELFEKTMVVGYYAASPIFIEPMIAQSTLLRRESFDVATPAVAGTPAGTRYPTQFQAVWDSTSASYRFTFSWVPAAN